MVKMTWRIRVAGIFAVSILLLGAMLGQASDEPFDIYEDWSNPTIRSDRWRGYEDGGQEIMREVKGGKLIMRYRREGTTSLDSGSTSSDNVLEVTNPALVDKMEADFRVRDLIVTGCAANAEPSRVRAARLRMGLFNDGTSTGPGDRTGNHFAAIEASRTSNSTDAPGILRIRGRLNRCSNSGCSSSTQVSFVALPQTVTLEQKFTLRMIWDAPNDQVLFGVDTDPDVSLPYVVDDSAPVISDFAHIHIFHTTANCMAGPTVGDAETEVFQVRTNTSAVIP